MTPAVAAKKRREFDPKTFLSTIKGGRIIAAFSKKQAIFVQGDSADSVFYIQAGKVRLTVFSTSGKEATIGILNEGDFFGEGCLTGQPLRMCSATAMPDCSVMRIDKKSMMEVLHREHANWLRDASWLSIRSLPIANRGRAGGRLIWPFPKYSIRQVAYVHLPTLLQAWQHRLLAQ